MKTTHYLLLLLTGVLAVLPVLSSARNKGPEPVLTDRGQELKKTYSDQLDAINKEISAALPVIDGSKKDAFEAARTELSALKAPREDDAESVHKAYHLAKPLAEAKALEKRQTSDRRHREIAWLRRIGRPIDERGDSSSRDPGRLG